MDQKTASLVNTGSLYFPEAISEYAARADWLFHFIYWLSAAFLVGLILFTIWLIRSSKRRDFTKPDVTHNSILEFSWTIIPIILVAIIFYWGYKDFIDSRIPPSNAIEIRVTGQMWSWVFEYPGGIKKINKLTVPINTPVKLIMSSKDVLHSFYLPNLRIKRDLMPNRYTTLWFNANKLGNYQVFCTEYCGDQHSNMLATLIVVPQEKYANFLATGGGEDLSIPLPKLGERLYISKGCNACHSLDGSVKVGPSWKGIYGQTRQFKDGTSGKADDNYIRESMVFPQRKIVKGYAPVMPAYSGLLNDREINGLIEYIKTLK